MDTKVDTLAAWKEAYSQALITQLHPGGNVLEVGFGPASKYVHSFHPKSHIIIERDPHSAREAKKWSQNEPNISVIEGDWEEMLGTLGQFDSIVYNDYLVELESLVLQPPDTASLERAKELVNTLQTQISQLSVRYSDKEIDAFYETTGKLHLQELPTFLDNLKKNGFITEEQYDRACKKYCINETVLDKSVVFLEKCLKSHMHPGSRITCSIIDGKSKFEDPLFFDKIITNPNLHYEENEIAFDIPGCSLNKAIVMVVERLA